VRVEAAIAAADMNVNDAHATYSLGLPSHRDIEKLLHGWLYERGYAAGCVHPSDDLDGIRLYVIPHWAYFDPAWVRNLTRFVRRGGTLVIGARTATRNTDNQVVPDPLPGCLRELAGVTVEEYGRQNAPSKRPLAIARPGGVVATTLWYEALETHGRARAFARWEGRHLTGQTAISVRAFGKRARVLRRNLLHGRRDQGADAGLGGGVRTAAALAGRAGGNLGEPAREREEEALVLPQHGG